MTRTVIERREGHFVWYHIEEPTQEELQKFAQRFSLHPEQVQDCLEPEHLPKYEAIGQNQFVILRGIDQFCGADAVSVRELTNKLALFWGPGFLLTVTRKPRPYLTALMERLDSVPAEQREDGHWLVLSIFRAAVQTFLRPMQQADESFDETEANMMKITTPAALFGDIFTAKRKTLVYKRMLRMMRDALIQMRSHNPQSDLYMPIVQDTLDTLDQLLYDADTLVENFAFLLNLNVSLEAQRTNDIVRFLTIFSAFFLPLTFIAGVYGMNFDIMPELRWQYGYYTVWGIMAVIVVLLTLFFKRKGWIKL